MINIKYIFMVLNILAVDHTGLFGRARPGHMTKFSNVINEATLYDTNIKNIYIYDLNLSKFVMMYNLSIISKLFFVFVFE